MKSASICVICGKTTECVNWQIIHGQKDLPDQVVSIEHLMTVSEDAQPIEPLPLVPV
jgi:hypothetical protein